MQIEKQTVRTVANGAARAILKSIESDVAAGSGVTLTTQEKNKIENDMAATLFFILSNVESVRKNRAENWHG